MKKVLYIIFIFSSFISFGQKKNNIALKPNPNPFDVISKVLENIEETNLGLQDRGVKSIKGGHETGSYSGSSQINFNVYDFSKNINVGVTSTIYIDGIFKEQRQLKSYLINFKFLNSGGAYGTKVLIADWDGYSAKFKLKLINDKEGIDEVYIGFY